MTNIPFSVQPIIGYGVRVVLFDLHSGCFSGQSLWLVSSNTEGKEIYLPFSPLGGIPHHNRENTGCNLLEKEHFQNKISLSDTFITFDLGTVFSVPDLLVIWEFMTANIRRLTLHRSFRSNQQVIRAHLWQSIWVYCRSFACHICSRACKWEMA